MVSLSLATIAQQQIFFAESTIRKKMSATKQKEVAKQATAVGVRFPKQERVSRVNVIWRG
jgi:hypothetical protein